MPMPTPSPAQIAIWRTYLAEAQAALHALRIGRQSVEVVADGLVVKYARASLPDLEAYIAQLEAQIAGRPVGGAIGFVWSR
jgi:hypothetical protein